ncbi:hypothetical protein M885DRAFT_557666 [Pelagophyceae sp. CCMP2097]|nr:hypothetical protein M885DRAFT_557666 [Pelagophyceae sp. CCMP2097]
MEADAVLVGGGDDTGLRQLVQRDARYVKVKQELADATDDAEEKQDLVGNLVLSKNAKIHTIDECRAALQTQRARIAELEAHFLRERRHDAAAQLSNSSRPRSRAKAQSARNTELDGRGPQRRDT